MLARTSPLNSQSELKKSSARSICGILAHTKDRAITSIGLPALRIAAATLDKPQEQEEILALLGKIREETGWKVDRWQEQLASIWKLETSTAKNGPLPGLGPMPPATKIHHVRALYEYTSHEAGSLSFRCGDIIQVITRLESGWCDGMIDGRRGWFPSNFCEAVAEAVTTEPMVPAALPENILAISRIGRFIALKIPLYRNAPNVLTELREFGVQLYEGQFYLNIKMAQAFATDFGDDDFNDRHLNEKLKSQLKRLKVDLDETLIILAKSYDDIGEVDKLRFTLSIEKQLGKNLKRLRSCQHEFSELVRIMDRLRNWRTRF